MSGLDMMSAISNKEHLAGLPPKPGSRIYPITISVGLTSNKASYPEPLY